MFVKICGTTTEEDALLAVAMGADAVGFIFAPSPRQVQATKVRDIVTRMPREVLTVGVFRDAAPEQVLDISERGRSLGVILISAQQFMSAVHGRVTGNAATKVLGRTGSSEVYQPDYRFLDDDLKLNMTRLAQGELIISHNVYRQPVKVVFPRPAYQQKQF